MLSIEVNYKISSESTFPIDLNDQVVVSRVKFYSESTVSITVDEIIDVFIQLIRCFIDFEDNKSYHWVFVVLSVFAVIVLNQGNVALGSVGRS